jgi:hypothetical protein
MKILILMISLLTISVKASEENIFSACVHGTHDREGEGPLSLMALQSYQNLGNEISLQGLESALNSNLPDRMTPGYLTVCSRTIEENKLNKLSELNVDLSRDLRWEIDNPNNCEQPNSDDNYEHSSNYNHSYLIAICSFYFAYSFLL